jgi:hypothetical protein
MLAVLVKIYGALDVVGLYNFAGLYKKKFENLCHKDTLLLLLTGW